MTLRDLLGLRPKDTTAAALRAAQTETEAELARARSAVATLEGGRAAALLDAPPADAELAEAALASARATAERLAILADELRRRAEAAATAERVAALTAEAAELATEADAIASDLRAYPDLCRQLVALFSRELEHERRRLALADRLRIAKAEGLPVSAELPPAPRRLALPADAPPHATAGRVGASAFLPSLANGKPLWGGPSW